LLLRFVGVKFGSFCVAISSYFSFFIYGNSQEEENKNITIPDVKQDVLKFKNAIAKQVPIFYQQIAATHLPDVGIAGESSCPSW